MNPDKRITHQDLIQLKGFRRIMGRLCDYVIQGITEKDYPEVNFDEVEKSGEYAVFKQSFIYAIAKQSVEY